MTLFQGTLKTISNRHKCDDTLPPKKENLLLLGDLKTKEFTIKYFVFRKLCHILTNFCPKKKDW